MNNITKIAEDLEKRPELKEFMEDVIKNGIEVREAIDLLNLQKAIA